MPVMPGPASVIQLQFKGIITAAGGRSINILNSFYYFRSNLVPAVTKSLINTTWQSAIGNVILAAMNVRFTQQDNIIRIVNDALDLPTFFTQAGVGAIGTDSYDTRSAVYFNLQSAVRGKRFRSSKHFTPLSEIDTTGDILTGAGLARWEAVQTAMLAGFSDGGGNTWLPMVLSGPPLSQIRNNPTTVYGSQIVQILLNKAVGQMKRRRAGSVY